MFLSVFDVFKIGVGPSSSHTMGPMSAAGRFLAELKRLDRPRAVGARPASIVATMHGSLAFTGVGHGTGRAVILGLCGQLPASVDPDQMDAMIAEVEATGEVRPEGHPAYRFRPAVDLIFDMKTPLPGHPNGMEFVARDQGGQVVYRQRYFSVGGGFVLSADELVAGPSADPRLVDVPFPFENAQTMLSMAEQSGLSIAQMKRANEERQMSRLELDRGLDAIWAAMNGCILRGMEQDGTLPGGLKVHRRAKKLHEQLQASQRENMPSPTAANDWLCLYAMAVNEENAAGGRVVTAPTNGAAGVVPAVLKYTEQFLPGIGRSQIHDFLLTAAAVGGLIKHNASISGAEVGCQGEVGSASAMAAAAICAVMGGTPRQVENAAEIALEHHLGMTCDPVKGLVQIPCIERNAFGAVKAITAASLALRGDGEHVVSLDACVETMRQTGLDMSERYKETSLAGLAANVTVC
ncbi:L-serine ammonia-lyase [Devosia sp. MC532]|uniref:L-serine ammonia-lyase n=1 Tax=Devosia sp. MC532 TaxID=2799788 RepID=UPI0018F6852E|nr:L-serine ammonia-lyase [Devosia sp. MC532]MBJ7577998.1 L-serine ammonia-lyase [Devosia sp. MC532]